MINKFLRFFIVLILPQMAFGADVPGITPGLSGEMLSGRPTPFQQRSALLKKIISVAAHKHQLPTEADELTLTLSRVIFHGNHVFDNASLEKIFLPYMKKPINLRKLQELVEEITQKYHASGYFLSKAMLPPQKIHNGTVDIQILEGFISKVQIQGIKDPDLIAFLGSYGDKIIAHKPIKLSELEHYLLIMNDISGFAIKSVLAPDPSTPLGAKLTLITQYSPAQFSAVQDNYQTRYLGTNETAVYNVFNSMLLPGGSFTAHISMSDIYKDLSFYAVQYDQTLARDGLMFHVSAATTDTNPQFVLTDLDINGKSSDINASFSYPLLRSRLQSLTVNGELELMNNSETILKKPIYDDKLFNLIAEVNYNDTLWQGNDNLNLSVTKGLPNKDLLSRGSANANFFKITANAAREQYLTSKISFYSNITAQYANIVLPSVEVLTFGGGYLGRGYDLAQFTGDNGFAGTVEMRFNIDTDLKLVKQIQYFAFYDAGILYSLIPDTNDVSGASAGLGIRTGIANHLSASGFVGTPLTRKNATQVILQESGHQPVLYFQISLFS